MNLQGNTAVGIEELSWIDSLPTGWTTKALSRVFETIGSGHTPPSDNPVYYDGDCPWVTTGELREVGISETSKTITSVALKAFSALRIYPSGTLLVAMYGATIGRLGWLETPAAINQACCAFASPVSADPRYVYYCFIAGQQALLLLSSGGGQPNVSQEKLRAFRIPQPPLPRQAYIASFLDLETGKIDVLVAEQKRLIALLKEKRQAVISQAVTKGLDPNVKMKDSGVEWLGEVPAHWEVTPLMWLTQSERPIMYGIVLPGPDVGVGIPILKGGNVKPNKMSLESMACTTADIEAPFARARLRHLDLVYSIRGSISDCEIVPGELENCNITQDVARVAPARDVNPTWLRFSLLAEPVKEVLACGSLGAAVRGINIFDLKRVRIPTPPKHERDAIAKYLSTAIKELDQLSAEAAKAIVLLLERRAALISAAVTGKIDVRDHVAAEQAAA